MTDPCKHRNKYPENVALPPAEALEHFTECMSPEARLEYWETIGHHADVGMRCVFEADHKGIIERQRSYKLKLLTGIRKVIDEYERVGVINGSTITAELQELIS